jgi:polysaccharide deacetylase family protein (PEP-CTERM system associated)
VVRNCLSVDVEEWFHICVDDRRLDISHWTVLPSRVLATTRDLLELFAACDVRATFFVLGWIAERYPELVGEIMRGGHEIGSHGHLHRRVYEMTPDTFRDDLAQADRALRAAGAPPIRGYRAPEWSINAKSMWALDSLAQAGFAFDSSMAPMKIVGDPDYPKHPHRRQTEFGDLMELPPLVDRRFGHNMPLVGWGLRMSRPKRVLQAIEERNSRGVPVTIVVHPWEIDPDPPRIDLPWSKSFAHYFCLGGFRRRLEPLLRGASFAPATEVLDLSPVA